MALKPQWKPATISGTTWTGFDQTATPPWLMLPHMQGKAMLLDFAAGKIVRSVHPRIAKITAETGSGQSRVIWFEGKNPGNARIEVSDPGGGLEATLGISVKLERKYGIGFFFVEDKWGDKTIHQQGIEEDLIKELNGIYFDQTNITFESNGAIPLKMDIDLDDVVVESRDIIDKKVMTGFSRIRQEWVWKKIFKANEPGSRGFNIFFVPADKKTSDNDTLIFTDGNNCVIEDGRQSLIYSLAHSIGRMLGCDFTSDPNRMNQLMFWDPGIGKDFFSRSDDFIPRNCVNTMNP
jgi:hypothetical protein